VRAVRAELKEAVSRSLKERSIGDLAKEGSDVAIPTKRISEPRFRLSNAGGKRNYVLPGNKEFTEGDTLPRPQGGQGGGGREGSPDGHGEDAFQFTLSRDEYLDILFEDLELPDLIKADLKKPRQPAAARGYSPVGSPSNLALLRTMRNSLARRVSLNRPNARGGREARGGDRGARGPAAPRRQARHAARLSARADGEARAQAAGDAVSRSGRRALQALRAGREAQHPGGDVLPDGRLGLDDRGHEGPRQAVLPAAALFLLRRYKDGVDIVFIRHTSEAQEVDEETFFRSRETGGTVVSTALKEMHKVIAERYPAHGWNIYGAQASDGDNYTGDTAECLRMLRTEIMPLCQYFAYIEVREKQEAPILSGGIESGLWRGYEELANERENFAMKRVFEQREIFPVFRELFAKDRA
jgi:uncharacterized sporulation protein YeaH/YhbH (DUF444 family)